MPSGVDVSHTESSGAMGNQNRTSPFHTDPLVRSLGINARKKNIQILAGAEEYFSIHRWESENNVLCEMSKLSQRQSSNIVCGCLMLSGRIYHISN